MNRPEDIYEPLSAYRDCFKAEFSRLTKEKFAELTAESGIDVEANRRQVREIHRLERELKSKRFCRGWCLLLAVLALLAVLGTFGYAWYIWKNPTGEKLSPWLLGGGTAVALAVWMFILCRRLGREISKLKEQIAAAIAVATEQLEPLNQLYTWDIPVRLIEATVPRLAFDPYFTAKRLRDLRRIYAWDDDFNNCKSIVFAQSGVINGNPFVLGEYLRQGWEQKTYTGYLTISWWETECDSEGRRRRVRRTQTLTASVQKPAPTYSQEKVVIYGNDAAPNLTFSREPSGLDDQDLFDGIREKWRLHKLKKFSRNLQDESQFTLMSNHEFESWFHAKDRNNEVEFRMLFTALAQNQMMALMKDLKTGFGDDFRFIKRRKLNYLYPRHLSKAPIDTDPSHFQDWDYDRAAQNFQTFNEEYFRNVYFALAPLLAIPLYQQTRTHEEIWKDVLDSEGASFWEYEALANYYGEDQFQHPDCITRNLLKTKVTAQRDGVCEVAVTAHGFRGVKHIEYVEVYGGDGNYHDVPVEWIEYLPVERTSAMQVSPTACEQPEFQERFTNDLTSLYRRGLRSFLQS